MAGHPKAKHRSALGRLIPAPAQTFSKSWQQPTAQRAAAHLKLTRPLVSVWTVLSVTELANEDSVLEAIEAGELRWAFNVARPKSGKRSIRVLSQSVIEFINHTPAPRISDAEEFAQIVKGFFPMYIAAVRATKLAMAWGVSGTHISHLIDERELRLAKGSPRRKGRGGSPQIEVASAVEFLKRRRIL